jgi:hypothetical protein
MLSASSTLHKMASSEYGEKCYVYRLSTWAPSSEPTDLSSSSSSYRASSSRLICGRSSVRISAGAQISLTEAVRGTALSLQVNAEIITEFPF